MVTYKQLAANKTQICIPNMDYKLFWPQLCTLFAKFGGHKLRYVPGKLFWIINASLTDIEKLIK